MDIYTAIEKAVWSRPVRERGKVTPPFKVADCATDGVAVFIARLLNEDLSRHKVLRQKRKSPCQN